MNKNYLSVPVMIFNGQYGKIFSFSLLLLTGLISGCATPVKQEPFTKFAESAETLRDGTDRAMEVLIPQTVARYKKELQDELKARESSELYSSARLELSDGSPFDFESVPNYMVFDQFKVGLREMTDALHKYSVLLRDFADDEMQSKEEFDKFATELNANAFEALRVVDKNAGTNSAENVGLISTVAAAAFNNYLKSKQKEVLVDAVEKNQSTVVQYTDKVQQAIKIIANASNQEYLSLSAEYAEQMLDQNKSSNSIDALIKLNRDHFSQIQALKTLNDAVGKFPSAHNDLKNAAKNPDQSLSSIIELVNRGNQLKSVAESAKKANTNTLLETDAKTVEAQAVALEVEAKLASLDASSARADAVVARLDANANPDNAQKEQKAKNLEEKALALKGIADKKAADAKLLREAADAVKASVKALTN